MPLQSGTYPRLTTSQPVYLLVVHPVTAPEKEWAKPLSVVCLLTRCLVPVCGLYGGGRGFVCDLLLDQRFTELEISL